MSQDSNSSTSQTEFEQLLKQGDKKHHRYLKVLIPVLLLAGILFLGWRWWVPAQVNAPAFKTDEVKKGDILATVSATGTLQPTNEVDVGSELSGTIDKVFVDYNDQVKKGQLLAQLNTDKINAQVLQTKAALAVAKAGVIEAQATLEESDAQLKRLEHVRKLTNGKLPSQADFISAEAAEKRAMAAKNTAIAKVEQAQANLDQNLTDLSKTKIISPIDGVVLVRSIEPGQTVAAAMSAPVLFTLAQDLTNMELQVDVDEADVGQVKAGQKATFTVDAYPNRLFPAVIKQVRYGAQTTDGVVTYTTLLEVNNPDLKLRPGMTATAEILVKEKRDVLTIPVAATRFTPEILGDATQTKSTSIMDSLMPGPGRIRHSLNIKAEKVKKGYARVWKLVNKQPEPILIKPGESNGNRVEVLEGDVKPGDKVIIGAEVRLK
ncbi:efflux RND transporter periplasmic adaptor subunit [Hydrogenovibrio marinus]|uniref:Uncharacterized protein n=1 Tax=Hydrogenovibrio marinus TaxID=28885 RepID=A0A067A1C6_HYDMR|nr:efflux RND transporter periplasmic adaptor subunit [Hydrogenovibrio marinus]KDN96421.1 hypothetical protein EI16_09135 [Hydrogenovibrio marinus]BBN60383.1 secretion protein HlyD [Hydrogenovibrio marinus]